LEAFFPTLFHLDGALLDRFQNEFEKAVVAELQQPLYEFFQLRD
jgi:hypothetical protein